jgi:hypothetical protein
VPSSHRFILDDCGSCHCLAAGGGWELLWRGTEQGTAPSSSSASQSRPGRRGEQRGPPSRRQPRQWPPHWSSGPALPQEGDDDFLHTAAWDGEEAPNSSVARREGEKISQPKGCLGLRHGGQAGRSAPAGKDGGWVEAVWRRRVF